VDDYGDLNVDYMSEIDMFGLRNQFPEKMQSINDRADEADQNMSETSCIALLSELHTACGEDTCTEPNMDSFQLSVDQVGSYVDTHTKLKVAAIGEFYDFQRLTVRRVVRLPTFTNTPLNERRPVRCCRDDEPTGDEEIWYKSPIAISASLDNDCPYAWEQKWTGDVALPPLPVLDPPVQMSPFNTGFATYLPPSGTYTVQSVVPPSIAQISGTNDFFYYSQAQTTGDIDMRLRLTDYTGTTSDHCAGLMIRQSLEVGARHFSIVYCGDKRVRRLRRNDVGGSTQGTPDNNPRETDVIEGEVWLRITFGSTSSNPNTFLVFTSTDGIEWDDLGWGGWFANSGFTTSSTFFVGIAVSSGTLEAGDFTINGVPALPNDLVLPSTPPVVDGYTSYNQRICNKTKRRMFVHFCHLLKQRYVYIYVCQFDV